MFLSFFIYFYFLGEDTNEYENRVKALAENMRFITFGSLTYFDFKPVSEIEPSFDSGESLSKRAIIRRKKALKEKIRSDDKLDTLKCM